MTQSGTRAPGRTTVGDKRREAMVEAAYQLFMERGYETVSVDEVIRVAGGSKATLYKFFGNKEGLLRAVVASLADQMLRKFDVEFSSAGTARETLLRIGAVLAELALSDNAINQHRHAVAHARTFPDAARLWYESGPLRTISGIAALQVVFHVKHRPALDEVLGQVVFSDHATRGCGGHPQASRATNYTKKISHRKFFSLSNVFLRKLSSA